MQVCQTIDEMADRISQDEAQRVSRKIRIYSNGVKAKLEHANYAFTKIRELSQQTDASSTSPNSDFTVSERIHFYVDSFFAFLYSSFDVTAQIINQKMRLNIDERKVSIKSVKTKIDSDHVGIPLQVRLEAMFRSVYFKNLEKYRNCSTHRRQIYIWAETVTIEETPGYSMTGEITTVRRLLCDDPLTLNPSVDQQRELISYCENMLNRVCNEILNILNTL